MSGLTVPVVIVDDHRMMVLGLRTLFHNRPEFDLLAFAHDAAEALVACRKHRPRVAVVDVALEGSKVDGLELCRRIRSEQPQVEVVVYTGIEELGIAERAFAAGARGVVSKGDPAGDLLKAVLLASRAKSYTSPAFAVTADLRDFETLTPKQLTALRLLAQGLERKEIAERMSVGEETVKSHLTEVRRRLRASTSAHAVAIGLINSLFVYSDTDLMGKAGRFARNPDSQGHPERLPEGGSR